MERAPPAPHSRFRPVLRIAGWNAGLILAGLALIAIAGEAWLRLTDTFVARAHTSRFVPGAGVLYEPHSEVRFTNGRDYWTVSRANSLGFLDREPPDPARAAASCHVAVVGDSFVAAREVAIGDKLHVRLEALAARELPELDVTASAYGRHATGTVSHLPFYDEYARRLRPNLLVLVFVHNDFSDNHPALQAVRQGWDPDRPPYALPARAADGGVRLRPPDPDYAANALPWFREPAPAPSGSRREALTGRSRLARWLDAKRRTLQGEALESFPPVPPLAERAEAVSRRPGYGWILDGWRPTAGWAMQELLVSEDPPPVLAEARELTAWALAGFKRRADADGAALLVLSAHTMGGADSRRNSVLRGMAEGIGVPVISQHDWIAARGRVEDAQWPHDSHWSPQGHQWAAEAILDWLRRRPEVCDDPA